MAKLIAIVQARLNSKRLPNKILLPLADTPMIWHVLDRIGRSKHIEEIYCSFPQNVVLENIINTYPLKPIHVDFYDEGAMNTIDQEKMEENVIGRFFNLIQRFKIDSETYICRVTGDNPLIEPNVIDGAFDEILNKGTHYLRTFGGPIGTDVEIFKASLIEDWYTNITGSLTFTKITYTPRYYAPPKLDNYIRSFRLTVDTQEDYNLMSFLYRAFYNPTIKKEGERPDIVNVSKVIDLITDDFFKENFHAASL